MRASVFVLRDVGPNAATITRYAYVTIINMVGKRKAWRRSCA